MTNREFGRFVAELPSNSGCVEIRKAIVESLSLEPLPDAALGYIDGVKESATHSGADKAWLNRVTELMQQRKQSTLI